MLASCEKPQVSEWENPAAVCLDEAAGDYSTDKAATDAYTFTLVKNEKGGGDDYFCGADRYWGDYGHQRDQNDIAALKIIVSRWDEASKQQKYALKGHLEDNCSQQELPEQKTDGHTWKGEFSRTEDQISGTLYMDGNPIILNLERK